MNKISSVYIHFPHCLHLCNYCDFFKNISNDLEKDIGLHEESLNNSLLLIQKKTKEFNYSFEQLQTLYIGGGTPSLWGKSGALYLLNFVKNNFGGFAQDYEFTLEVNPKAWSKEILEKYMEYGVNRFSIGVQSLNPKFLKILDRYHDLEDVIELLEFLNGKNANFSVDLMLGLPYSIELERNLSDEIQELISFNPSHFSVYILTVRENYKHWEKLPSEEEIEREYLAMTETLARHGYHQYEVSNFSKVGFESKHNLKYWTPETVLALGPSATGYLSEVNYRFKWNRDAKSIEEEFLTDSQVLLEKIYLRLRTKAGLAKSDLLFSDEIFIKLILKWKDLGYLNMIDSTKERIILNAKGYLMLDSIMNDLYPYIK